LRSEPLPEQPAPPVPRTAVRVARSLWAWVRPVGGVGILAFLLWRLGTGPFLDGVRLVDGWALAAALSIGALTTVCCAWRWSLVAGGLGVRLPLRTAVAHCYRSVFLNATLPGGVLGDVHRAVRHGRDAGDVGRGIRAVVWERTAGQVVQAAIAMIVLFAFPSPVRSYLPAATALVVAVGLGAVLLTRALPRWGFSRWAQPLRAARADVRNGLLARRKWLGIVLASAVVVVGHLAMFLVAARTAGSTAPLSRLVPLTLLALLAMGLPANVGGFGPREGVAAWAFGAAGLTATQGVAIAVVYGALVLVSSLPGAAVLVVRRIRVAAPVPQKGVVGGRASDASCSPAAHRTTATSNSATDAHGAAVFEVLLDPGVSVGTR
jgi:glycosyltransferase 2 family protein